MTFEWNIKNNFILSHFIALYQQQNSLTLDINWSTIANDISLDISSSSIVKYIISLIYLLISSVFLVIKKAI